MRGCWWSGALVMLGLLLAHGAAQAVIQRLTPLKDVIAESQVIFTVTVTAFDAKKPSIVFVVDEPLKGKPSFDKMAVNLGTGDADAKKDDHTAKLLKRLTVKMPLVLFATKQDKKYVVFAYTNGTWFQVIGSETEKDKIAWSFTHCEPFLRRTFKGSTEEMKQVVADAVADKKKPPEADTKEKPGFGPEVTPEDKPEEEVKEAWVGEGASAKRQASYTRTSSPPHPFASSGPLFAVIPSVAIGGAIAVLAALFPAVFGGLMIVMRRWLTLLTVASLNSTLYSLHLWLGKYVYDKWWGSAWALWLTMLAITLIGTLWAWRRNLAAVRAGEAGDEEPSRLEKTVLWVSSLLGLAAAACLYWLPTWRPEALTWKFLLVLAVGMWAGWLHLLYRQARQGKQGVPTEGVVLWAMVCVSTGLAATWPRTKTIGSLDQGDTVSAASYIGEAWNFLAPGQGGIDSSPLVEGSRLYFAAAHGSVFGGNYGKVYCLSKVTKEVLWTFPDDKSMKQVFSSPCIADGRLYIGEGFHQDADCKLYCLDAATGNKLWDFQTTSHTESSPCVAGGKVFFGAGDDGVYCLDAASGELRWHYENEVHIDGNPLVVGKRLYVGSGVGDLYSKLEIYCLDTDTGKADWHVPVDLPAWGMPTAAGAQLFVGLGNGNFMFSDDKPRGAMLCLDTATGKEQWRVDVADGVLVRPAVDRRYVYFGSRDGHCYCLDRKDGRQVWKRDLGGPIVASPALARCTCHACSTSLFVTTSTGVFCALEPASGQVQWQRDFSQYAAQILSSPAVEVMPAEDGERRRIYLGTGTNGGATAVLYCLEDRFEE